MAETVHSVADAGNQLLLLVGGKRSRRRPRRSIPFGYGRERYFWAFAVALVLFSMGGMLLYEGIQKFRDPHEVESLGVAVATVISLEADPHRHDHPDLVAPPDPGDGRTPQRARARTASR